MSFLRPRPQPRPAAPTTATPERYEQVVEERDEARTKLVASRAEVARLAKQIAALRNDLTAAREELEKGRSTDLAGATIARHRCDGDPELRRRLQLAERARRSLVEQLDTLQTINEAMTREVAAPANAAYRAGGGAWS